jgi:uncharacterized protein YjbJ (UPF0337 family)
VDRRKGKIDGHVTDTSACGDDMVKNGQGRMGQGSGRAEQGCGAQALPGGRSCAEGAQWHNEQGCIAALKQAQAPERAPPTGRLALSLWRSWKRTRAGTSAGSALTWFGAYMEVEMDWNRVEGSWKQVKGKIKEQWGKLTDDDLDVINGRRDQLEGKIQERYGYAKDQARKEVDDWYTAQRW